LTSKAQELAGISAEAARALAAVFDQRPPFEAATASSRFVVTCSELLAARLMPELAQTLKHEAEHVEIEVRVPESSSHGSWLASGADLALGSFENVPERLNQQWLYEERPACLVRVGNPHVRKRLTLEAFARLSHLEIAPEFETMALHIDRALSAVGKQRHVALRVPYYLLARSILERTDHVATLPRSGAEFLARTGSLRVLMPPVPLPGYKLSQIWLNSRNNDPAHLWLRKSVARICQRKQDSVGLNA